MPTRARATQALRSARQVSPIPNLMKALQSILVAVDFTPSCRAALREAALRASFDGAALTAVMATNPDYLQTQAVREGGG